MRRLQINGFLVLVTFATIAQFSRAPAVIVAGAGAGSPGEVRQFNNTGALTSAFFPYSAAYTGGVRVGLADITHDGIGDIITGTGPGTSGGHVKVFDGLSGVEIRSFLAFPGFTGGVFVAGGDLNGDGFGDIVVGSDEGSSHVKVFDGQTNALNASFLAYGGFTGGVRVGAADVTNDGRADIITGSGPGAAGHVKVFDGATNAEVRSFLAYGGVFTGGIFVAGGDANLDGFADIVTGVDSGASPHVKVFNGLNSAETASFFAYAPAFTGGVRVASADLNSDGRADLVTGSGPQSPGHIKVFNGLNQAEMASFLAFPAIDDGAYVAAFADRIPEPNVVVLVLFGSLALCRRRTN
jgi:trimeric autotransporter adhesin